jgi:Trk K+ transport system NAD-binding subunit
VKFLPSQLAYLFTTGETRTNLRALARYLLFLALLIVLFAVVFHAIAEREGQQHSWVTGLYWTLTVMTTLGFGDITFTSDLGRLFSVAVLLSGVVLLLVMLPFLFIRLFYAPWLEARLRFRAPRKVPADTAGHVIITGVDPIALELVERLATERIPYFIIEPDPARAAELVGDGLSAVTGEPDSRVTFERLLASRARLVFANSSDAVNANITLTVREVATALPLVTIVEDEDSVDVLQLAGATHVLPLKHQLGEQLANRVYTGRSGAHVMGRVRDVEIAELPARDTPFSNQTVRDTRLRERTGVNIVGLWSHGALKPAYPHTLLLPDSVIVVAGTPEQVAVLNELVLHEVPAASLVIVIGGGTVGRAAVRALVRQGITVHMIDRDPEAPSPLGTLAEIFVGNAADRQLLERAGLNRATSVLLTTNDDATNVYLALYCRRLKQDLRIVSRVTLERNVEAIHRAGADFALSYTSLGVEAVMSRLLGHEAVLLGEGVELFAIRVPKSLVGRPLRDSGIGSRTGLSVVALQVGDTLVTRLGAETVLPEGADLLMLGSVEQRQVFAEAFEGIRGR